MLLLLFNRGVFELIKIFIVEVTLIQLKNIARPIEAKLQSTALFLIALCNTATHTGSALVLLRYVMRLKNRS